MVLDTYTRLTREGNKLDWLPDLGTEEQGGNTVRHNTSLNLRFFKSVVIITRAKQFNFL